MHYYKHREEAHCNETSLCSTNMNARLLPGWRACQTPVANAQMLNVYITFSFVSRSTLYPSQDGKQLRTKETENILMFCGSSSVLGYLIGINNVCICGSVGPWTLDSPHALIRNM